MIRGGSWNSNARNVRAAYRNGNEPGNRDNNLGFRLARAPGTPEASRTRLRTRPLATFSGGESYPGASAVVGEQELPRTFAGALFEPQRWILPPSQRPIGIHS